MSDCLFCGIIDGTIKADIVYRDETVLAFKDIVPRAPVHILIIPRAHIATISDLAPADGTLVGAIFFAAAKLVEEFGIAESGYRVVVNCGPDAGQTVLHLHYHLLGGRQMGWPPG
ncbi:MAG: HIT domain-containing protein [Deltaproteobacteria bacterium]|nr:HIT domain-containing protein [Deltaproteobacteria bacterium]